MSGKRHKTHITGNVGLYFVCYKLSRMGWNVMPTARNAKGVDIIAYNSNMTRMISIQVKALSTETSVLVSNKSENITGDFWVIVNNIEEEPQGFILFPSEVKRSLRCSKGKSGKVSRWIPKKKYEGFKDRWDRIGYVKD
jgi:hypothetical protein